MTRARMVVVAAAVAAWLLACDGATPVQRGYGSRQISQLRDTNFWFAGARGDIVLYAIGITPDSSTYFSIDLRTGAVAQHDPSYADIPYPQYSFPSDPNARYHCSYTAGADNQAAFRIDDGQTGTPTIIMDTVMVSGCPTESDPTLELFRADADGNLTLWSGPFDNLQMAPIDLTVTNIAGSLGAGADAVTVLAARTEQPDALGIYSIDLTTFAVTEVVPPALTGGAWADGATPAGVLDSAGLDPHAPDGVIPAGDHFIYWRAMADGGETLFVGPLASGPARELALFTAGTAPPKRAYVRSTTGHYLSSSIVTTWQRSVDGSSTGPSDLLIWDDPRQRLLTCPSAFQTSAQSVLSDDHSKLAAFVLSNAYDPTVQQSQPTGPLVYVDLASPAGGSAACTTLVDANVNAAGLAPDGSAMFWLVEEPYPSTTAQLFLAAPDGSAPRQAANDRIEGPPHGPHFVGPSQLEVDIFADLVWADVHDDPIVSHSIAERTTGGAIDRGRWLIIGYDKSSQDGTAILGIVNRDSGEKRPISPDVATFFTPDLYDQLGLVQPSPTRTSSDPLRIVYLVQGRNPSPQDGIWVANIYPSDTP